jgi:hypothetical protein
MAKSKTQQALDWLAADPKRTAYQASKEFGISQQAIGKARKKTRCPCCGQFIK